LLLLVALVGTTIAPWQIFFQQSNVVDKRITPRWLAYSRCETAVGAIAFALAAGAVMIVCAAAFDHGSEHRPLGDAAAIAHELGARLGHPAGAVFAIALLNASLLGAGAVSLSSAYAVSEARGVKHSLHRRFDDARTFHGCFAALVLAAAATVLVPHAPLGAITLLVQALAGILLPTTLVLLLLLSNDAELLGPLTNPRRMTAIAAPAIAVILALSTMLTITTTLPHLGVVVALELTLGLLAAGGVAVAIALARERTRRAPLDGLTPWQRRTWTSPALERIPRAPRTRARVLGLALLRGYTTLMILLLAARLGPLLVS
jgi:Mn2+/Fe2+ NRAMP family transporter